MIIVIFIEKQIFDSQIFLGILKILLLKIIVVYHLSEFVNFLILSFIKKKKRKRKKEGCEMGLVGPCGPVFFWVILP